jgi:hypothetical protein
MITVKRKIRLAWNAHGRRRVKTGKSRTVGMEPGRVPRISQFMSLAIRMDEMLRCGEVIDQTKLVRLSHVTQPRMTQTLNLNLLPCTNRIPAAISRMGSLNSTLRPRIANYRAVYSVSLSAGNEVDR